MPRSQASCIFCRLSHRLCKHPALQNREGKCDFCQRRGFKCGPYEASFQSLQYLESLPERPIQTTNCPSSSQSNIHPQSPRVPPPPRVQPSANVLQSSNAAPSTTTHTNLQSSDEGYIAQIYPESLGFDIEPQMDHEILGNPSLFDDTYDPMILEDIHEVSQQQEHRGSYQDLGQTINLGPSPSHNQINQDTFLKPFNKFDATCSLKDQLDSQIEILSRQKLHKFYTPMEKPREAKKKIISLLSRSLREMKILGYEAESSGNLDRARWMYYRLTSALDRVEDFSSFERRDILERIARFYKQHGDHTEADRLVQKILCLSPSVQSTYNLSPTALYREFMEKTPEIACPESADFKDILPPLHRVVACGHEELFSHLRSSTSEASTDCCIFGRTSLHAATEKGSVKFLEELLEDRVEIDARDSFGRTSLFLAASLGREGAFRFLLSRGPNLEVRDFASFINGDRCQRKPCRHHEVTFRSRM